MSDVDEKYKKELKELFEKVSYEVSEKFGLKNKPGIDFSHGRSHNSEKSEDITTIAYYSHPDDKIYITSSLLKKYKQGHVSYDIIRYLARHENIHRVRDKLGYTFDELHSPMWLGMEESYRETEKSYESQLKNFVKKIAEEAIADLYGMADMNDETFIVNRLVKLSKYLKKNEQFYGNISEFLDALLSYMEQLKKVNEGDGDFVEKFFSKRKDIEKLRTEMKNVSLAYKKAFNEKIEDVLDDLGYVDFSKYGYDKRIKSIGYFLGTLAALGLKHSRNKYEVSGLVKEKDPLKLLDNILGLAKEGKTAFEKKVRYLYDSGRISKETYETMMNYVNVIDKLPLKRKYYEKFLYSLGIMFLIFFYFFFSKNVTGLFGLTFSSMLPSIFMSFVVLYTFFVMLKR